MFHDFYNIYKTGFTYYDVFFNITFIVLISIISSIIYWDLVNKNSLAKSSCNNIKEIIEQNANSVEPYIYNIILIKTDTIYDINYKNYAIKITYNFKKQKTDIDIKDIETFKSYDKTIGNMFDYDDASSDTKQVVITTEVGYTITWNEDDTIDIVHDESTSEKDLINKYINNNCSNAPNRPMGCTNNNKKIYYRDDSTYIEYHSQYTDGRGLWRVVYNGEKKLVFEVKKIFDFLTYYDLSTGQKKEINNIYRNNSNKKKLNEYEFICVDKNYKRIKTKAAKLLCTFTKEYLFNDLYSKAIIDNINIANKKKYKIVL